MSKTLDVVFYDSVECFAANDKADECCMTLDILISTLVDRSYHSIMLGRLKCSSLDQLPGFAATMSPSDKVIVIWDAPTTTTTPGSSKDGALYAKHAPAPLATTPRVLIPRTATRQKTTLPQNAPQYGGRPGSLIAATPLPGMSKKRAAPDSPGTKEVMAFTFFQSPKVAGSLVLMERRDEDKTIRDVFMNPVNIAAYTDVVTEQLGDSWDLSKTRFAFKKSTPRELHSSTVGIDTSIAAILTQFNSSGTKRAKFEEVLYVIMDVEHGVGSPVTKGLESLVASAKAAQLAAVNLRGAIETSEEFVNFIEFVKQAVQQGFAVMSCDDCGVWPVYPLFSHGDCRLNVCVSCVEDPTCPSLSAMRCRDACTAPFSSVDQARDDWYRESKVSKFCKLVVDFFEMYEDVVQEELWNELIHPAHDIGAMFATYKQFKFTVEADTRQFAAWNADRLRVPPKEIVSLNSDDEDFSDLFKDL